MPSWRHQRRRELLERVGEQHHLRPRRAARSRNGARHRAAAAARDHVGDQRHREAVTIEQLQPALHQHVVVGLVPSGAPELARCPCARRRRSRSRAPARPRDRASRSSGARARPPVWHPATDMMESVDLRTPIPAEYQIHDPSFFGVDRAGRASSAICTPGACGRRGRCTCRMATCCCGATCVATGVCGTSSPPARRPCTCSPPTSTTATRSTADGRVIACEHGTRSVVRFEHDGSRTVLAERFDGKRLNSPNDVVVASDGSIWFTDPTYGIDSFEEGYRAESEIGASYVYRIDPATGAVTAQITDMVRPNGLALSLDERSLYVADTGASHVPGGPRHIRRYDVDSRRAGSPVAVRCSPSARSARSTGSASTQTAASGRAARSACTATRRTATLLGTIRLREDVRQRRVRWYRRAHAVHDRHLVAVRRRSRRAGSGRSARRAGGGADRL